MSNSIFTARLETIAQRGNLRTLPHIEHAGDMVRRPEGGHAMVNLSSNDYLALASDHELRARFESWLAQQQREFPLSASSSRLLTGNFSIYDRLEARLAELYGAEAALVFNSGYHANSGILPAITTSSSLILADKLVHASLIDGIRLSAAKCVRYAHNNYEQLEELLRERAHLHDMVVVVSESIFSMDGDAADLERLVALKASYPNLLLYIDEAHAVGAMGATGLGYAEECGVMAQIDILVGTFGKALASVGAYAITSQEIKEWLVNTMRTLIFTTALPPLNLAWSLFVMENIASFAPRRAHLSSMANYLRSELGGESKVSCSHIIPIIVGESSRAVALSAQLQEAGFYLLAVRPPTVPVGTSRLRLSLTSAVSEECAARLITTIKRLTTSKL
ncbi:MAG: 8-amino-7-oxononanoate synthase [Rikenellaceae bacterium]